MKTEGTQEREGDANQLLSEAGMGGNDIEVVGPINVSQISWAFYVAADADKLLDELLENRVKAETVRELAASLKELHDAAFDEVSSRDLAGDLGVLREHWVKCAIRKGALYLGHDLVDKDPRADDSFHRKVASRVALPDGCEEITLECGHRSIAVGGVVVDSTYCAQCLDEYLEERRAYGN